MAINNINDRPTFDACRWANRLHDRFPAYRYEDFLPWVRDIAQSVIAAEQHKTTLENLVRDMKETTNEPR